MLLTLVLRSIIRITGEEDPRTECKLERLTSNCRCVEAGRSLHLSRCQGRRNSRGQEEDSERELHDSPRCSDSELRTTSGRDGRPTRVFVPGPEPRTRAIVGEGSQMGSTSVANTRGKQRATGPPAPGVREDSVSELRDVGSVYGVV
jgi:hypothetical protein